MPDSHFFYSLCMYTEEFLPVMKKNQVTLFVENEQNYRLSYQVK